MHPYARIIIAEGQLEIGRHCNVQSFTTIAVGNSVIRMGDHVRIGPNSNLLGGDHRFEDRETPIHVQGRVTKGLVIGDDIWVGANCVVLPGITIGRGAIVGAGSVVTKNVPEFTVVAGNPARPIKTR